VTVLNHLAQAAAIILLLELMVVLLVFLAVAGGLGFGLHWVNGKSERASELLRKYTGKSRGYVHTGTDYAALPVVVTKKYARTAGAAAEAVRRRVREIEAARTSRAKPETHAVVLEPAGAVPAENPVSPIPPTP
jgi:hypothetical protein